MDVLSSIEFRKRYAKLTEPTTVTVNGHVIGTWTPHGREVTSVRVALPEERYDTRPIRAVPKKR